MGYMYIMKQALIKADETWQQEEAKQADDQRIRGEYRVKDRAASASDAEGIRDR